MSTTEEPGEAEALTLTNTDEPSAGDQQPNTDDFISKENFNKLIIDLNSKHSAEITELKNQLDEVRSKATIIETTKQDELDEIKFKTKEEIDSLNHIINALQHDLNSVRSDYKQLNHNFKEYKKHVQSQLQQQHAAASDVSRSPVSTNNNAANKANFVSTPTANIPNSLSSHHNINQENENLEEDMRKAKESADLLRSVVLPLETEISSLRVRSNTSEKRIKELEKLVDEKEKEKQKMLNEEQTMIDEELNSTNDLNQSSAQENIYFKKCILLKKYLKRSETKFIDLEQSSLKAIKQLYSLLSKEQKFQLTKAYRPKSKSVSSSSTRTSDKSGSDLLKATALADNLDEGDALMLEKNETIVRIEELLDYLLPNTTAVINNNDSQSNNHSTDTSSLNSVSFTVPASEANNASATPTNNNAFNINQMPVYSYGELLALYEREKLLRLDVETDFQQKTKESNKQIENLNREMTNLAIIIDDLRNQYVALQSQYKYQLEQLAKINDQVRNDMKQVELKNEQLSVENLKLKAENKQFYGDQKMCVKELDEEYQSNGSLDEVKRNFTTLKQEMAKFVITNQALNKQLAHANETIRHLQKVNTDYQRMNNIEDHMVITQSLESELERERKVRVEAENDKQDYKNQLLLIKEKGQALVESLKQKNDKNEFEIKKMKEENQELANQIQSLKKDAKNSLSVQEDLVRLIQSLQIELNQCKHASEGQTAGGPIEVRCQHEDDFNECAACKAQFSVTKRKHRCKHCCKIFCADCCAKTVHSGPNLRPHKVCNSCHTLLDKDSAPVPSNASST